MAFTETIEIGGNRVFRFPAVPGGFGAAVRAAGLPGLLIALNEKILAWHRTADLAALESAAQTLGLDLNVPGEAYLAWVYGFANHNFVSGTILSPLDNIPASGEIRQRALEAITAEAGARPGSFEDLLKGNKEEKGRYEAVVAAAVAAPASGPTPNNVRISRILATTLGACAVLACAPPFLGGAHACMQQPPGDGYDSHHMPAKSTSPLDDPMGPAIKIDPLDHKATNSYGAGVNGPMYADRRALISAGRVYAAFRLDVAEIRRKFPGKYDAGLAQAEAYAACLKAHGFIR